VQAGPPAPAEPREQQDPDDSVFRPGKPAEELGEAVTESLRVIDRNEYPVLVREDLGQFLSDFRQPSEVVRGQQASDPSRRCQPGGELNCQPGLPRTALPGDQSGDRGFRVLIDSPGEQVRQLWAFLEAGGLVAWVEPP
jgi:hypothetical protein